MVKPGLLRSLLPAKPNPNIHLLHNLRSTHRLHPRLLITAPLYDRRRSSPLATPARGERSIQSATAAEFIEAGRAT